MGGGFPVCIQLLVLMCLTAASAVDNLTPIPLPSRQTSQQAHLFAQAAKAARSASTAATPYLLRELSSPEFRQGLHKWGCSHLEDLPAPALLSKLRAEIDVAELMHNFGADPDSNDDWLGDFNLVSGFNSTYFYNQWEMRMLGFLPLNRSSDCKGTIGDSAETQLYGCTPFTGLDSCPANFTEASERPIYVAANLLQIDMGNPFFGDVSIVFRRDYIRNLTVTAAVDTGLWEMTCNASTPSSFHHQPQNCSAWDPPEGHVLDSLGTLDDYDHLILGNTHWWNGTELLLKQFGRMLGDGAWGSIKVLSNETITYYETNIFGNVYYGSGGGSPSGGIRFVLGSFPSLFGSVWGTKLQAWCTMHRWVLVWSLGPNMTKTHHNHSPPQLMAANQRLLDPVVLAGTTVGDVTALLQRNVAAAFNNMWANVASVRANAGSKGLSFAESESLWAQLTDALPPEAQVRPLAANRCQSADDCIGTTSIGNGCVCYNTQ